MSINSRPFVRPTKAAFASAILAISCVAGCNQQDQQAQNLVRKAIEQQKAGDTEDAVKSLNRSISYDPDLAEAFYLRGSCHAALGNESEALRDLEKTRSLRPDWDRSWWALGTLHRSMNQDKKAVDCLKQSVSLNPDALDARYDLACLLLKMGDTEGAMTHLAECRKKNPDDVRSLMKCAAVEMNQDPRVAVETLSHVLTLDRSNAYAWTQRAIAQERGDDIPRALADFTVACRLQPKSSQAWFHRGRLLSKLNRHEEAVDCLTKATELAPADLEIKNQLKIAKSSSASEQAARTNQLVEKRPADSGSVADAKKSTGDFALFPAELSPKPVGKFEGDSLVETKEPAQEASSEFALFPGGDDTPAPVVVEAKTPAEPDAPSFDFPAFGEVTSDSAAKSDIETAMLPEANQPFEGLQIPNEALAQVTTPAMESNLGVSDLPPAAVAANERDESSPFSEFSPEPAVSEAASAEERQFADLTEIDESVNSKSSIDDAATVVIGELNPQQPASPRFTVDQLDALYQQALADYRKNDISACKEKLTALLQHAPKHENGRLRLASILEEQGQLEDALGESNQLLSDFGISERAVLLKARIQKKMGRSENAVDTYSQLIDSQIPSPVALSERADLLLEAKQYDEAISDLSKLIDAEAMLVSSLERRALAYESQQHWGLAVSDWTTLGRIDGSNLNALEHRADAFAQMGETQPAIADLQNLLRLQPTRIDVVQKLCDLNASVGRWDRVYQLTAKAVEAEKETDEILFLKATAASQLGRTDEAVTALTEALKKNPKHQPARVRRAELLLNQQNFEASLADWNQAITLHGESANLLAGRASALAAMGDKQQAVVDLNQAISIEPNHISARKRRSELFEGMGDHSSAVDDAQELLRLRPAEPQGLTISANSLFEQGKYEEACSALEKVISSDPTNTDFIWKRAQCRLQLNQDELAIQDLNQLITLNPTHQLALKERSQLKEEAGSYSSAVADLDAVLQLNADDSEAWLNRGILNHRMAKFESAVQDLSRALDLQPSLHVAHYRRGLALQQLNRPDAAMADLEAAIEADSNNADYLYSRGNLFASQSINGRAIEDYAQAVALRPSHAAAWYNYGNMLFPAGKVEQAIDCWNKAIEIQPDLFRAYNNRAAAYVQLKEYQKAVTDYKRTLQLNPRYAHAYDNYAWLLASADDASVKNPQEAISLARKACELTDHNNWAYLSTLAASYAEIGDFDSAREWLVKSHELAPPIEKDRLIRTVKAYESELQRGSARKAQKRPGSSIRL